MSTQPKYKKGSFEAKMAELLPEKGAFSVIAHELLHDGQGWSTNDSWYLCRDVSREEAISNLRGRWEIFKANYCSKARVSEVTNEGSDEEEFLLNAEGIPFATVRVEAEETEE